VLCDCDGAVEARELGGEILGNIVSEAVRGLVSDLALMGGVTSGRLGPSAAAS